MSGRWRAPSACVVLWSICCCGGLLAADDVTDANRHVADPLGPTSFTWTVSEPLIAPLQRPGDSFYSIKDPTVVRYAGKWHLFCTIRGKNRSHQIEYLCFDSWDRIDPHGRTLLTFNNEYFCAPQVFFFEPHKKWYLIHQMIDASRKPALQPAYSTTTDLADPNSWSKPTLLYEEHPRTIERWIDFWVICDEQRAHLFCTSLDGRMWRAETRIEDFPRGWDPPQVVLRGDIFEASHTYRLKGLDQYLTVVEAQGRGRRYYKAYVADALDGEWEPIAATQERPFAGWDNTTPVGTPWTDSFSHGELLRDGYDQTPTVDPADLRFLFQGVSDERKEEKPYGQIPWRLGMLTPRQ